MSTHTHTHTHILLTYGKIYSNGEVNINLPSLVPRPSQLFQCCTRKVGGPGIRSDVTTFIHMKGGQLVKMNVDEQKVSKVQGVAVHDLLEDKASKLSSDCSTIILEYCTE